MAKRWLYKTFRFIFVNIFTCVLHRSSANGIKKFLNARLRELDHHCPCNVVPTKNCSFQVAVDEPNTLLCFCVVVGGLIVWLFFLCACYLVVSEGTPATARWQSHQPVAAAAGAAPGTADAPPPPHQRHFSVSFAVMNNYQAAAAAAAQGFGPPASPHAAAAAAAANSRGGFPPANSPGPIDMYSSSAADSVAGYVQAASPQPSGFPTLAVSVWSRGYETVSAIDRYTLSFLLPISG